MSLYTVKIEKKKDGLYVADADQFDVHVSAGTAAMALSSARKTIERDITRILQQDDKLPDEAFVESGTFVLDMDIPSILEASSNEIVRRTVSLPKWMDIMIRNSRVDSSAMFKQAVMEKLQSDNLEKADTITTVEELKKRVSPDVLKSYVMESLFGNDNSDNKGGNRI